MILKYNAALVAAFALAFVPACASPIEDADGETNGDVTSITEQALTQEIYVKAGDPIAMVAAPYVVVNAAVGDVLHLNAVYTCPTSCTITWRDPDQGIARYGGVILGYGNTLSVTKTVAGNSRVSMTYCQRTSATSSRCIATMVYVTTTA